MPSFAKPSPQIVDAPHVSTDLVRRIKSEDLFAQLRELNLDHEGPIYRLRVTQLNKLMLPA